METEDLVQQARVTAVQVVRAVLRQTGRACLEFLHRLYCRIVGWRSPAAGALPWQPQKRGHCTCQCGWALHAWSSEPCMCRQVQSSRAQCPARVLGGCTRLHRCTGRWLRCWAGLMGWCGADAAVGRLSSTGLMVMDMGSHMLPGITGSHLVIQALVPGLEERAREFPALSSMILKTGAAPDEPLPRDSGA